MPYAKYPPHLKTFMTEAGPSRGDYVVHGGRLLYHPARDSRFPYIYELNSHPLDPTPTLKKRILVYVMDTSKTNLRKQHKWENSLSVPLGPDSDIDGYGLLRIDSPAVVFARELGCTDPNKDVFVAAYSPGRDLWVLCPRWPTPSM